MAKKKILVVDDEQALVKFMKKALEQAGDFDVSTETRPTRALQTAQAFKPDLVFMDIAMPDMDGGEVAAQFMEDAELKDVPMIFLTGAASKMEVSKQGGMIGGRPFLAKPVRIQDLVSVIEQHLGPSPSEPTPTQEKATGFIRKLFKG